MSCEMFSSDRRAAKITAGERWQLFMRSNNITYAEYRAIFGVCDNTARNHLDHAAARPDLPMLALAFAAFGMADVLGALFGGSK